MYETKEEWEKDLKKHCVKEEIGRTFNRKKWKIFNEKLGKWEAEDKVDWKDKD